MLHSEFAPDHAPRRSESEKSDAIDFMLPLRARPRSGSSYSPSVLVASSDENLLYDIAEIVFQCGLPTCLACTVDESKQVLERQTVSLVVCDDRLIDGNYEHILREATRLRMPAPVIVVSPTGDWPDYLKAMGAGAFDYVAYPPIPGDLPRTIYHAWMTLVASDFQETEDPSKGELR